MGSIVAVGVGVCPLFVACLFRDKVVRHHACREGVNSLMSEIDHLLVAGPSPGWCADACRVLQGLVIDKPEIMKMKEPTGPRIPRCAMSAHTAPSAMPCP